MLSLNKRDKSGFTIVELLIVIVVIGILAAIIIVAYNGVQQRARNTQTTNAAAAYLKGFNMMIAGASTYPTVNPAYICLGQASCRGGTWTNSAVLDTELKKYMGSSLPAPSTSSTTDSSSPAIVSMGFIGISANITLDGTARNWLIYALEGVIQCPVGPVVSGSWPEFLSAPPTTGRTATIGTASACYVALPNS